MSKPYAEGEDAGGYGVPSSAPAAAPAQIHPFVEKLAHQLAPTTKDPMSRLVFTDTGLKLAEELIRSTFDRPAEFQYALQAMGMFADYLVTDRESPIAGKALHALLKRMVPEQHRHNLAREAGQREKVGAEFKRFTDAKPTGDVLKDKPVISARELLRGQIKR